MTDLPTLPHGLVRTEDFESMRLVTAKIIYRMPDRQSLLQEFIWQQYDLLPKYPILLTFLKFWKEELEGPLYKVIVGGRPIFTSAELIKAESHVGLIRVH
jgi:uncharacterized protein Usg